MDQRWTRRLAVIALVVLGLAGPVAAQVVRVYEVRHRTAEELEPLVETALAGEGRAIADRRTNTLVLSGSARAVASAVELLAVLDVRARTVVLRYEARRSDQLASAGASVRWRAGAGTFRIGDVHWAGGAAAIAVDGRAARRASTFAGELRILDGQSGRIATGAEAPVTSRRIRRTRSGAVIEESTQLANAESGFEATPRVLRDGRVELALRGFEAALQTAAPQSGPVIGRTSAETRIVLVPGATVALGGIAREESGQDASFAQRAGGERRPSGLMSGGGASDSAQQSLLLVTVNVE